MIKKLELTCFGKHVSSTIDFTSGLSVLRGANEAGKSTMLNGISYALFGTRVLPGPLEDMATWGHNVRDLKVVLHYGDYVISRSKAGAEVTAMGQTFVTGQVEVTRWCEQLLGADATTANSLMFANQMGLRGILNSGPKATSVLIEDLAEFKIFDEILEAAEHKLSLGSAAIQEDRLRNMLEQIQALPVVEEPAKPNASAMDDEIATLSGKVNDEQTELAKLNELYQAELCVRAERDRIWDECTRIDTAHNELLWEAAKVVVHGEVRPTTDLETEIADATEHATVLEAYQKFLALPLPVYTDRAKVEAAVKDCQDTIKRAEADRVAAVMARTEAKAKLVTSSVCGFCNQDVSNFPEVALKNAALQKVIEAAEEQEKTASALRDYEHLSQALTKGVFDQEADILRKVRGIEQFVERDDTVVPVKITWKGQAPSMVAPDVQALKAELAKIRAQNDAILKGRAKLETLSEQREKLATQRQALNRKHNALVIMEVHEFQGIVLQMGKLEMEIAGTKTRVEALVQEKVLAQQTYNEQVRQWKQAVEQRRVLEDRVAETRKEIDTLAFNNGLVKKVRAARPTIGNTLWTMVLMSVSKIFSAMRGEESLVTKGKEGFLVNGKPISCLSGSTQDLLGLAVRVSLVKMFVPNSSFLILDEPSAACDQDRTNALLGYVAASGFEQVIMVTHNQLSESFADTLIEL